MTKLARQSCDQSPRCSFGTREKRGNLYVELESNIRSLTSTRINTFPIFLAGQDFIKNLHGNNRLMKTSRKFFVEMSRLITADIYPDFQGKFSRRVGTIDGGVSSEKKNGVPAPRRESLQPSRRSHSGSNLLNAYRANRGDHVSRSSQDTFIDEEKEGNSGGEGG